MSSRAVSARDAGLVLVSRITKWIIAGAVTLAGVLSLIAAHSFKGRPLSSSSAAASTAWSSSASSSASGNSSQGSGTTPLQQPSQSPAPAPVQSAPAPIVSGGS